MGIFSADDLILFMLDIHSLQRATTILDEVLTKYGLCINVSKTKTMILKHMLLEDVYPDTIISVRNVSHQNSTEFKYLGSYISQNKPNTGDIEINHRIQIAYAKFTIMNNLLPNSKIQHKTRVKFLNSFVYFQNIVCTKKHNFLSLLLFPRVNILRTLKWFPSNVTWYVYL